MIIPSTEMLIEKYLTELGYTKEQLKEELIDDWNLSFGEEKNALDFIDNFKIEDKK